MLLYRTSLFNRFYRLSAAKVVQARREISVSYHNNTAYIPAHTCSVLVRLAIDVLMLISIGGIYAAYVLYSHIKRDRFSHRSLDH